MNLPPENQTPVAVQNLASRRRLLLIPSLFLVGIILGGGLLLAGRVAAIRVPAYEGWVTDQAQVIAAKHRQRITAVIEALKQNTGAETAVLTVKTTAGEPIFDYAMAVAEAWKPGEKGKDNGVLFLVATQDRKMYILVGYGLEGVLPDGKVGGIEDEYIIPHFKAGDFGEGILQGVVALASEIDPENANQYQTLAGLPAQMPPSDNRNLRLETAPGGDCVPLCGLFLFGIFFLYLMIRHPRLAFFFLLGMLMGGGRGRSGGGSFGGGFGGFGGGSFGGGGAGRSW